MIDQSITSQILEMQFEELTELEKFVSQVIEIRKKEKRGKRAEDRIKTLLNGTCTIEREKEFFDVSHKVKFKDISPSGVCFSTAALIFPGDVLTVTFRSPYNNALKDIFAEVLRVSDQNKEGLVQVAAKGVEKKQVMEYRKMLAERKNDDAG